MKIDKAKDANLLIGSTSGFFQIHTEWEYAEKNNPLELFSLSHSEDTLIVVFWSRWLTVSFLKNRASLAAQLMKSPLAMQKIWVRFLGCKFPLVKGTVIHSSILAWRIPWTIQSTGSQRFRHNWATFTFTFLKHRLPLLTDMNTFLTCYQIPLLVLSPLLYF